MLREKIRDILLTIAVAVVVNAIFLAMAILLFHSDDFPNGDKTVYTTQTGECYHLTGCSSLYRSKYRTTIRAAVANGYRQCSNCEPPALKGEDGFHFSYAHYLVVAPFTAMWTYAGAGEILKRLYIDPPRYFVHLAIAALLSLGFDMLI